MKNFRVQIWFGGDKTELVLMASNNAHAIVLAKRIYPSGRVVSANEVK